jgi:hypothetical protein
VAVGYLIVGILCGSFASTLWLLAGGSFLSALIVYSCFGQLAVIGAAGFNFMKNGPLDIDIS